MVNNMGKRICPICKNEIEPEEVEYISRNNKVLKQNVADSESNFPYGDAPADDNFLMEFLGCYKTALSFRHNFDGCLNLKEKINMDDILIPSAMLNQQTYVSRICLTGNDDSVKKEFEENLFSKLKLNGYDVEIFAGYSQAQNRKEKKLLFIYDIPSIAFEKISRLKTKDSNTHSENDDDTIFYWRKSIAMSDVLVCFFSLKNVLLNEEESEKTKNFLEAVESEINNTSDSTVKKIIHIFYDSSSINNIEEEIKEKNRLLYPLFYCPQFDKFKIQPAIKGFSVSENKKIIEEIIK